MAIGRPIEWTEEKVNIEADYLVEWAQKEDSLVIGMCYGQRGYSYQDSIEWSERNEAFRKAKKQAMTIIGSRREHGGIMGKLDSAIVRSSMGCYDPEHRAYLKEMKRADVEASIHAENIAKEISDKMKSRCCKQSNGKKK